MPVGRPSKYNEEIVPKLKEYIGSKINDQKSFPSLEEFAGIIGVNTDTIQEWKNVHEEFSVAIKDLFDLQKNRLMSNGLRQEFNPTMSIFLLKANHGMIETEKRILAGDKDEPIRYQNLDDSELDATIKQKTSEIGID